MKKTNKPWGYEIIWAESLNKYIGKLLHINAGHRTSKQYSQVKDKTVYVIKGILYIYDNEGKITRILPGGSFHVKSQQVHRFGASETSVELIEVSTHHLNDVIRVSDDYNRGAVSPEDEELEELYRIYGGD